MGPRACALHRLFAPWFAQLRGGPVHAAHVGSGNWAAIRCHTPIYRRGRNSCWVVWPITNAISLRRAVCRPRALQRQSNQILDEVGSDRRTADNRLVGRYGESDWAAGDAVRPPSGPIRVIQYVAQVVFGAYRAGSLTIPERDHRYTYALGDRCLPGAELAEEARTGAATRVAEYQDQRATIGAQ